MGSPIVDHPDVLAVMNLPSLDKYEDAVVPGGSIFVDSTLVERKVRRSDVKVYYIPATQLATDNGMTVLANMVLAGKIIQELGEYEEQSVEAALRHSVSARHSEMFDLNKKALALGRDFE